MPVQQVLQMRQQGTSDNQIVLVLQKQGFTTQQIFDAMSQADIASISARPESSPSEMPPEPSEPTSAEYPSYPQEAGAAESYPEAYPQEGVPQNIEGRIHEVAEAIINEKWDEIFGEIQKVVVWKEKVEADILKLKDDISAIKEEFGGLRQGVLGKIGEYDERMRDVSSNLKAVQTVFKDVIPSFTENVAELSRLTKTIKKNK